MCSASEPVSRSDRRGVKTKTDDIKWQDLMDKFRAVQTRHEKARSRQPNSRSPQLEPTPNTPALQPKRNASVGNQGGGTQPTHKKGGRSIQTITQGIMGVGRSSGDAKGAGAKRKG